ncbi:MAG: CAAX prenyl protease-related protein [Bryobacterales bacterium]|nr:CAAX prenyl protease-related protein [Bryobacterales bacterium]
MERIATSRGEPSALSWCSARPWIPWAAPFIVYILVLASTEFLPLNTNVNHVLRLLLCSGILAICSRKIVEWRPRHFVSSLGIGITVFLIWVGPDFLFPGYRLHWLFSNSLIGNFDPDANAGMAAAPPSFFVLRFATSVLLVPIVEELFWRGFLMRFLIRSDFTAVPLGAWQFGAFMISAVLFGFEHGAYWDVGIAAGIVYNAWMVRSKSLADLIWAHAITNGLLAVYVVALGRWEFWP